MKLTEMLVLLSEYDLIAVRNDEGYVVDMYDGRNAISERYNECEVTGLGADYYKGRPRVNVWIGGNYED